ncbi:MAG TPA: DNRLRE domain-containing protein, partial [Chitinophagaceae bacterium]|nr:DNRLRE domain-containing protein [Chitinophagaceae bacterium]
PVADAYVRSGTYANTNFGSDPSIVTKAGTGDGYREGYLRFNLASLTGNVTDARIRLYVKSKEANSTRSAYAISSDTWSETGITYNTKPAIGASLVTDSIIATGWVEFNVTGYVNSELAGDKLASFCIKDPVTNNNIGTDFYSKENGSNAPVLKIISNSTSYPARVAVVPVAADPVTVSATGLSLDAYPNPANSTVLLRWKTAPAAPSQVKLYNEMGVLLITRQTNEQSCLLSLEGIPRGIYFIELSNNGRKTTKKITKQ